MRWKLFQIAAVCGPLGKRHCIWAFTAAAVALLVAVTLGLTSLYRSGLFPNGSAKIESHPSPLGVARIEQAKDVRWCEETAPAIDAPLAAGNKLAIQQGLLEVVFDSGVRVIVEGPAEAEVQSRSSLLLLRGKLTAEVPAGARGFAVHTPNCTVVDLGTRFGVACRAGQNGCRGFPWQGSPAVGRLAIREWPARDAVACQQRGPRQRRVRSRGPESRTARRRQSAFCPVLDGIGCPNAGPCGKRSASDPFLSVRGRDEPGKAPRPAGEPRLARSRDAGWRWRWTAGIRRAPAPIRRYKLSLPAAANRSVDPVAGVYSRNPYSSHRRA